MGRTRVPEVNQAVCDYVEVAAKEIPQLAGLVTKADNAYGWPNEDQPALELDSLRYHSNTFFRPSASACVPSDQEHILYLAERAYADHCVWNLPDDYLSYRRFEDSVARLDMQSSPGFPYMREATSNGLWLKWDGLRADEIQKLRLWHDVQLVFRDEYEHITRVFVKQEPHKIAKIEQKRWRLIMASSLPVQVAWHMLFSYLNDIEIDKAYDIPSQQGIVLVKGGWRDFMRSWDYRGLTCGLDKSAWDWTAPKWALDLDLQLRFRLGRGHQMNEWLGYAKILYRRMFEEAKLLLSDGSVYRQTVPGVMKSGCVNTISTNSHCQVFLHLAVCLDMGVTPYPLPVCCGDDTLQHARHAGDLEVYRKYGIVVKSVSDKVEFVGHEFSLEGPRPMYLLKHLKKLRYIKEDDMAQYLDSMARMYVHTPYFQIWSSLASAAGKPLPLSYEAYKFWYDYSF